MITMKEALLKAGVKLKAAGVETPRLDAEVLLSYSVGVDREDILLLWDKPLKAKEEIDFAQAIARRANREPVALITGVKEFWFHRPHRPNLPPPPANDARLLWCSPTFPATRP